MKINSTLCKSIALMSMMAGGALQAQSYNQDLVAFYPFNYSLKDASPYAAVASGTNVTYVSDRNGKPQSSAYFDGTARLEILDAPQLKLFRDLTISFWIKPDNNNMQNLFSRTQYATADNTYYGMAYGMSTQPNVAGAGVSLWVNDTKDCRYNTNWTRFTSGKNVTDWTQVTAVVANSVAKLYINGTLVKEQALKIDSISNCGLSNFVFGANWAGDPRSFYGAIDDIKIFKKGLSDHEAKDLYINRDLVAYYPLSADFQDKTSYGNHGVATDISFVTDMCSNEKVAFFNGSSSKLIAPDAAQTALFERFTLSATVMPISSSKMNIYTKALYNTADNAYHGLSYAMGSDLSSSETSFRYFHNDRGICKYSREWSQIATSDKAPNSWYTLTIVYTNGTASVYVNGVLESQTNLKASAITLCGKSDYIFGANWSGDPRYFKGYMRDLKIFDRPFSASEVQDLTVRCGTVTNIGTAETSHEPFVYVNEANEYVLSNPMSLALKGTVYDAQGRVVDIIETQEISKLLSLRKGLHYMVLKGDGKSWTFKVIR